MQDDVIGGLQIDMESISVSRFDHQPETATVIEVLDGNVNRHWLNIQFHKGFKRDTIDPYLKSFKNEHS